MQKAELASTSLPRQKRQALENFLALDLPMEKADVELWGLARKYNIALGPALEAFHKRLAAIQKLGLNDVSLRYRAGFGRRLDYYTGFVFEIRAAGKPDARPLAGGGRYDRLLNLLGAKQDVPAIGFAIWLDRLAKSGSGGRRLK